jgi:type IV secretory pathway VirB10-like protein
MAETNDPRSFGRSDSESQVINHSIEQNSPEPSSSGEGVLLGSEIPPLGASQGRPVNKKLIVALVLLFAIFVGGVMYAIKVIKPTGPAKEKKVEQQVVEDPPERKRVDVIGDAAQSPTQPIPLASGANRVAQPNAIRAPGAPVAAQVSADGGKPQLSITDKRAASGEVRSGSANAPVSPTAEDPKVIARRELVAKRTASPTNSGSAGKDGKAPEAGATGAPPNNLDGAKSEDSTVKDPCNMGLVSPEERRRRNALYGCDKAVVRLSDDNMQAEFTGVQARKTASNLSLLISRGTNVACVMDQRIISDFEGEVSCTLPNEIYSMDGKNRLLPKGSRLLGTYKAQSNRTGLDRLAVVWDRVRTPYGIDIELPVDRSPTFGTDALGSAGIPGRYEGYYWQKISTGLWLSAISDLFKYGEYRYAPKLQTITVAADGSRIITEQPFDSALVRNTSKISEQTLGRLLDRPGSIIVDQGQLVNTILTKDLSFEAISEVVNRGR